MNSPTSRHPQPNVDALFLDSEEQLLGPQNEAAWERLYTNQRACEKQVCGSGILEGPLREALLTAANALSELGPLVEARRKQLSGQ